MADDIDALSASSEPPSEPSTSRARRLLLIPAAVCTVQALGLTINGVGALIDPGQGVSGALVEAVVLALLAAGLLTIAVGLLRLKAWARGPLIAIQLIALLTAIAYAGLGTVPGAVLAVASIASLLVVVAPSVAEALEGPSPFGSSDDAT